MTLQAFAAAQLDAEEVPEPEMLALFATVGGVMVAVRWHNRHRVEENIKRA